MGKDNLPERPPGKIYLLRGQTIDRFKEELSEGDVVMDPTQFDKIERAGVTYYRYRNLGPGNSPAPGAGTRYLPYVGGENSDRLRFTLGTVRYIEIPLFDTDDQDAEIKNSTITAYIPTINGVPMDQDDAYLPAGGSCTAWLICKRSKCRSAGGGPGDGGSTLDPERIVKTAKGASKPPYDEQNEVGIPIADIDFEAIDSGGYAIKEMVWKLGSDHPQFYYCGSNTGDDGSSDDFGGSASNGGDNDDSSGSNPDTPTGCKMTFALQWKNAVSCFPAQSQGGAGQYLAGPFRFVFDFSFVLAGQPMQGGCPYWYYQITMPGAKNNPAPWRDLSAGRIYFDFDEAPACKPFEVHWKARAGRREGSGAQDCCAGVGGVGVAVYAGSFPKDPYTFGPVCGQVCDDMDHDGIPDDVDPDPFNP